ncbi:MAG: efflux RND transporter periplasmic adaptor subunit [Planctomycetes bacterium]|nr:efflux RND transporter periplasmic adaptor subunit [Planctomycetota bacterium]
MAQHPHENIGLRIMMLIGACTATLLATSCNRSSRGDISGGGEQVKATVSVVMPERATLRRSVRQPGNIQAYEQTPMFSKLAGYVKKWHVDIGDRVRAGDVLAEIFVPEMEVELKQKDALVQQADAEVTQAKETAVAAEAGLRSARARVKEAEASRLRVQAEFQRMKSQYERLARAGKSGVIDKESVEETLYGFKAAEAGLDEVEAKVKSAEAARDEYAAKSKKALADVTVAQRHAEVAAENREYVKALLQYAKLSAPFDGVITRRNVDTGHFVQPAAGPKAEPLYVVEKREIVRVFVEVPEADAAWVQKDATAVVHVQVIKGQEFAGKVTRTSYSLDRIARTLIAQIDLPNPKDQLRPGMYATANIIVEHANALTLPVAAVFTQGDVTQGYQSFCFLVKDGKLQKTQVEVGTRTPERMEVLKKLVKASDGKSVWADFTGEEQVVHGNVSAPRDGQEVNVLSRQ